jgi:hypothetical protein
MLRQMQFDAAAVEHMVVAVSRFGESGREGIRALELQLTQNENRLQRLADAFIDNMVDQDTYQTRRQALLTATIRLREEIANRRLASRRAPDPRRFFEHMKSLPNLFISVNSAEKREIVEITTSNRSVVGNNVCVEPANWLSEAHSVASVYSGDPYRPTFRRRLPHDARRPQDLTSTLGASEAIRFERLFRRVDKEFDTSE